MRRSCSRPTGATPITATMSGAASARDSCTTTRCARPTRVHLPSATGLDDLFSAEGTRAFLAWLEGPAPRGAGHGVTRYVFYRVSRERPDVLRAFPDLDGKDGPGYVAWCWAFGRDELSIPDRFMPPRPPGVPAPRPLTARPRGEPDAVAAGSAAEDRRRAGPHRRRRPGGAPDRLPRSHAGAGRGGARLRAGARLGRRSGEHGQRAAAPPRAAGQARGCLRPPRLRGPRAARRARLRDRRRQRRRAARLRRAPRRGLLRRPAHRHLGLGDQQHSAALAASVRAGAGGVGLLAFHGREHRRRRARARSSRCRRRCSARPRRPSRCGWACPRRLSVPVRVRLPEHRAAQEPGRAGRSIQAGVRARRGAAAADQDDQRRRCARCQRRRCCGPRTGARTST